VQFSDDNVNKDLSSRRNAMQRSVTLDKKISYRRGTARRAVSVVAEMFVELHLISPATGE